MRRRMAGLAALVLTIVSPAGAQMSEPAPAPEADRGMTAAPERKFALSAHVGPTFAGEITVANGTETAWDVDPGYLFRGGVDFYVVPKLTLGVYVLTAQMSLPERDEDFGVVGVGGSLMGRFGEPNRPHFRAGAGLSYQMNSFETASADDSAGLGVSGILEFAYPMGSGGGALLAHLSFLTQPAGGNENYDITFGPIVYLALGAEFGK